MPRPCPGYADVVKNLEDYGEIFSAVGWLPFVGPWIERVRAATKIVSKILERKKEGVGKRRLKIEMALRAVNKPIAVVVDDIDRLTTLRDPGYLQAGSVDRELSKGYLHPNLLIAAGSSKLLPNRAFRAVTIWKRYFRWVLTSQQRRPTS